MYILHVFIRVKQELLQPFIEATLENARNSVQEPGVVRFDVLQQKDDPCRFQLTEVYRTAEDPAKHKETAHYKKWAETAQEMLAEPRTRIVYQNIFPNDKEW